MYVANNINNGKAFDVKDFFIVFLDKKMSFSFYCYFRCCSV